MEISETKKPNKYATLIAYLVAMVCLLLGLFLPFYNGGGMLALRLPDVFNQITGNAIIDVGDNKLDLAFVADLFGSGVKADLMAYVILLYAVVTVVGLLALIPIGLTFNKESKVPVILEYAVLTASTLVLSLYVVLAFQLAAHPGTAVSLNFIIAFGGSLLALMVLSCINKKGLGAVKVILCLLSLIALLFLFELTAVFTFLEEPLNGMAGAGIYPAIFHIDGVSVPGIYYLNSLVAESESTNFITILNSTESVAEKIIGCVAVASAIIILADFIIDVISLSTNAKKTGLLFNVVRYGLAFLISILLLIMTAVCQYGFGLFAIIITVIVLIQLAISVLRLIKSLKKAAEEQRDKDFESQKIKFEKPNKQPKQKPEPEVHDIPDVPEFVGAGPIVPEPIVAQTIDVPEAEQKPADEQMSFIEPAPEIKEEVVQAEEPVHETPGEVQMIMEGMPEAVTENTGEEAPSDTAEYYVPEEKPAQMPEGSGENEYEEAHTEYEKPVYVEPEEVQSEPAYYEQVPEQPTYEQPAYEPPVYEQPVYEQPVYEQPVYEQPAYVEPVKAEVIAPVREERVEQPAYRQPQYVEPVQRTEPAPAPANEVPVRIEIQQPAPTRPFIDKRIYKEMYEQSDSFIDKLTEKEKTEFTRTFIEKANGDIGNIPEYVIGGSNKKFFSAVFIYLGRIRGMISDELLNKMFKELNML